VPELPEVEAYRQLAEQALGRMVSTVRVTDPRFVRGPSGPAALVGALRQHRFVAARRHGKLLVLDLDSGHRLGLHFGMTGRLLVDGTPGVDGLLYSSDRGLPVWDRLIVGLADGGSLVVSDPRLLGGASLDPDEQRLGPDARSVTPAELRRALAGSASALKARLLDQAKLAGVGNLMADELLWRASLAPGRRAGSLSPAEQRRLLHHLRATVELLMARGGSHMGDLMAERHPGGRCPRDGAGLRRSTIGGRTSWWCPAHQR